MKPFRAVSPFKYSAVLFCSDAEQYSAEYRHRGKIDNRFQAVRYVNNNYYKELRKYIFESGFET